MTTDVATVSSQAAGYATGLTTTWNGFITKMESLLNSGIALGFDFGKAPAATAPPPTIDVATIKGELSAAVARTYTPTASTVAFTNVAVADVPQGADMQGVSIDKYSGTAPQVTIPTAPASLSATPPGAPPTLPPVGDPPTAPTITVPNVAEVVFDAIITPTMDTIEFEPFEGNSEITPPPELSQNEFSFTETPYTDVFLTELETKLLQDLQYGGYGIEVGDERRLWQAARDREAQGAQAGISEVARLAAARGFSYPPGAMYALQQAALQDYVAKTSSVNRDIASKKADLYVQNRQFTMTMSKDTETLRINLHNAIMDRALKTAQLTVELGIAAYNAMVVQYKAGVELYQAEVKIWVEKRNAELYKVEKLKAEVEVEKAKSTTNMAKVEKLKAQSDVCETQARVFDSQIKAYSAKVEAQKNLIETFKNQILNYQAAVESKKNEIDLFKAQISGEEAEIALYKAQVDGHNGYLQVKMTEVAAKERVSEAKLKNAQLQVEKQKLMVEKYKADLARDTANMNGHYENERNLIAARGSQAQALIAAAGVGLSANKAAVDAAIENMRIQANFVIASGNVWTAFLGMKGNVAGQGAQAIQQALGSAYNMVSGITAEIK